MRNPFIPITTALFGLAACASPPTHVDLQPAQPDPAFSAPYRIEYSGRPIISVEVEGHGPFDFIFDTGSTLSALYEGALPWLDSRPSDGIRARVFGVTGTTTRPVIKVGWFDIGGQRTDDLRVVVLQDWSASPKSPGGILGLDVIEQYFVLVDTVAQTIFFFSPDSPPYDRMQGWSSARIITDTFGRSGYPLYLLEAKIGNRGFPALIDSGLELTIANEALLRILPTIPPTPQARSNTRFSGATEGEARSFQLFFTALSSGDVEWRERSVFVTDAPIFSDLGYADQPFMLIGFDLLRERSFAIDFKRRIFYAAPRPQTAAERLRTGG